MERISTPTASTTARQRPPISSEAGREQALRDYKVTIEYKHLKQHGPGGVYLVPSLHDLRLFHGVIFVRRGLYANGIFKFTLHLPETYNDMNAWPTIVFSSSVYHPHVSPHTGELDIRNAYPTWDPHRHYLVTLLTYLKKIFYFKFTTESHLDSIPTHPSSTVLNSSSSSTDTSLVSTSTTFTTTTPSSPSTPSTSTPLALPQPYQTHHSEEEKEEMILPVLQQHSHYAYANREARDLALSDPKAYRTKIESCVRESQRSVYLNEPGCTLKFTEESVCHSLLREIVTNELGEKDPNTLTRDCILQLVTRAHNTAFTDGTVTPEK